MTSTNPFSRYDITKIANPLFSYYQTLVPREHTEFIKFINSIALNAPYLIGLAKRYAAVMTAQVDYAELSGSYRDKGFTDIVYSRLEKILTAHGINLQVMQQSLFFNLFFYPKMTVTLLPVFVYRTTCSHCGAVITLSSPRQEHFEFTMTVKSNKVKELVVSYKCPHSECGKQNAGQPVDISEMDGTENEPGFYAKLWNPYYTRVERGVMRGAAFTVIDTIRFKEFHTGRFDQGGTFTYADLDSADPNFLLAIMSGDTYIPNPKMTYTFDNRPELAGIETALSPALLNLVGLLHTGSLRRGQEADAIIKASPNYLISPAFGEGSAINTKMDGAMVTDLAMRMVKEIQEGDTLGIGWFPSPITANKLFADPRRTVLEREIKEEEMGAMMTTGLDATIFSGGAGVINDPFVLHLMKEVGAGYAIQIKEFTAILLKMIRYKHSSAGIPAEIKYLPTQRIDEAPGTFIDKEYATLASSGMVPLGPVLMSKYKFKSASDAFRQRMDENRDMASVERESKRAMEADARASELQMNASGSMSPETRKVLEVQIVQEAEEIVMEMETMGDGEKQSRLRQMQGNDPLLFAMVSRKMQELRNARTREAKAAAEGQGGVDGGEEG
ncbi:MAG: hypothetical protein WC279_12805 [Sulfurimonas sp.]|jgi:hypothetical protein|uniref:hypothetical protein n=1 Tax=Sulfurimonas sp. TaxID=2022749 RepID=UPI003566BA48